MHGSDSDHLGVWKDFVKTEYEFYQLKRVFPGSPGGYSETDLRLNAWDVVEVRRNVLFRFLLSNASFSQSSQRRTFLQKAR
jgi:hypothetical protein